ncbi:MAG: Ig-like domain-containing protein [Gemmatimonadaceae bacterium]
MSTLGVSPARMLRPLRWSVVVGALLLLACGQPSAPASTSAPPATPVTPVVASVTVSPATAVLAGGATVDLSAAGFDRNGTAVPGRTVSWNSATPAVATVSNAGRVTAVTAGTASIRATIDGQSATASITVTTVPGGSDGFVTAVPPIDFNVIPARPTETSIALSLYSASTRTVTVTLLDENRVVTQALTGGEPAVLELTGLAPERSYRYRITGPSLSFTGAFRTARRTGSAFRFVMQADSHLDTNTDPALYTNTLRNMVADSADFLVDLGDTFMSDKYADFRDAAAQYYAQRHYFGIVGTVMPTFLVQGNHDAENGWLGANTTWAAQQRVRWFPPIIGNALYSTAFLPRP